MTHMFIFQYNTEKEADAVINKIHSERGCLDFKYRVTSRNRHTLRVVNTQKLNQPMIDLLVHEFSAITGYHGHLEISLERLEDPLFNVIIGLNAGERDDIRPFCLSNDDKI